MYYVQSVNTPIIDKNIFYSVQELLNKRYREYTDNNHILSKRIFCGKCGATYKYVSNKRFVYWTCRTHNKKASYCTNGRIVETKIHEAFIRLYNKLYFNYKEILLPLHTALQNLKLRKFSGQAQVMEVRKEIAKLREQSHVLARLKTKGFLDEAKYIEQTAGLTVKINKLQTELKKLTRSDDEDETLDQIEMLIDFFEKQDDPITKFEESEFESIVDKIVVINQHELEFHLIGGLKFKEKI